MREFQLEGSDDLGVAFCSTFPEIKWIQLYRFLVCFGFQRTSLCSHCGVGWGGVEDLERKKDIEEG
jgi:hypothetical protein